MEQNLWIYTNPNNAKAPLDYIPINKKIDRQCLELWGRFRFCRNNFRLQNFHGERFTKK